MSSPLRKADAVLDEVLAFGCAVVRQEAEALLRLVDVIDRSFERAVQLVRHCRGSVIVSGMGKAGLVGQKLAATLASTGSPSHFLHPAEAVHGDLGKIHAQDLGLLLSHSGRTEEVLRLLPCFQQLRVPVISITGDRQSALAAGSDVTLWIGHVKEAGDLQLAPTTSTTAMLALGDALALAKSRLCGFSPTDFARFHPGGSLGMKLARVEEWMRPLSDCRMSDCQATVREVLVAGGTQSRRSGAILLTDKAGQLAGLYTDSDLVRLLEDQAEHRLDQPIHTVMTRSPVTVRRGTMMSEAIGLLRNQKISELPVVDQNNQPLGLIDITDVIAFLPDDEVTADPCHQTAHLDDADAPNVISLNSQRTRRVDEG